MDALKTAPFTLGEGRDAVLLVHGFTGSPWDVRPLGEALAARGYFVKGIRLPGHGQDPQAMVHVGWRDWERAVFNALDELAGYRHLFVAGLSMGALLSVIAAGGSRHHIRALALMAPAWRFRDRTSELLRSYLRLPVLHLMRPWIVKDATDIADPQALAEAPILERWPTQRLYDLWRLQDRARKAARKVTAPALVAISEHDHVVSVEGANELARGLVASRSVRFIQLEQGFHIIPRDFGREVIAREVGAFFDRWREADEVEAAEG